MESTSAEIAQRSFQLRKTEVVTILFQTSRVNALALKQNYGLLSEGDSDQGGGHGQHAGPAQHSGQGLREFILGNRLRCGHVVNTLSASWIGVGHEMSDAAQYIFDVYPTH